MSEAKPGRRLSAAMIVRDEGRVLAESLQSVREIADEVVVLDTGSYDETPEIARRCGARVAHALWADSFAAARNRCLSQVRGDWVLWLDAGERLTADSARALRDFIDSNADANQLYALEVELPPAEPLGFGEQAACFRLMPRRAGLHFVGALGESLLPAAARLNMQLRMAPGRLLGHGRRRDAAFRLARARRNQRLATIEATELGQTPPRLLLAMGDALATLESHEQAREAYRQALASAAPQSPESLAAHYGLLAELLAAPHLVEQCVPACLQALESFPLDAPLLVYMGNLLRQRNELALAERTFTTAMRFGQCEATIWHPCDANEMAAHCLSHLLRGQGRDDDALGVLSEALDADPQSTRLVRALVELHVSRGHSFEAIAMASRLPLEATAAHALRAAIRGACKAAARDWNAALSHLRTAYDAGCRDSLCLRWLAVSCLAAGHTAAARAAIGEWMQAEPGNGEAAAYLRAIAAAVPEVRTSAGRRTLRVDGPASVMTPPLPFPPAENRGSAATPPRSAAK